MQSDRELLERLGPTEAVNWRSAERVVRGALEEAGGRMKRALEQGVRSWQNSRT